MTDRDVETGGDAPDSAGEVVSDAIGEATGTEPTPRPAKP
jgi:hypothetical protein